MEREVHSNELGEFFENILNSEGQVVGYSKDEIVYERGEEDDGIYRLREGGIVQYFGKNNKFAFNVVKPGEIFSRYSLGEEKIEQPCTAKALKDSKVGKIPRKVFKRKLFESPERILKLGDVISEELQERDKLLEYVSLYSMDVEDRISYSLSKLTDLAEERDGGVFFDFLKNKDIARMSGLCEEEVCRGMGDMEGIEKVKCGKFIFKE